MRRLTVSLALAATALAGCTQSFPEAMGQLGGIVRREPAPSQTASAQAPAPAPAPAKAEPKPAPARAKTASAEPKERSGFRIPGFGRRETSAPAPAKPAPPPPAKTAAAPAQPRSGGFLGLPGLPGFGGFSLPNFEGKPRLTEYAMPNDRTPYTQVTLPGLARGVRENTFPANLEMAITAPVDSRYIRQIVVDLKGAEGMAVTRSPGNCIQVVLPLALDQEDFASGHYLIKGTYRREWMPNDGFSVGLNKYDPACGDAYLIARSITKAP